MTEEPMGTTDEMLDILELEELADEEDDDVYFPDRTTPIDKLLERW